MGTDIHIEAEKLNRETGIWEAIPVPRHLWSEWHLKYEDDLDGYPPEWVDGRNYTLFAIFANVRNGNGFAGVKTGEAIKPIAMPRGLPDDISETMRKKAYGDEEPRWGLDGHTPSWLSLREVMEYPVRDMRTKKRVCVNPDELRQWRKEGTQWPSDARAWISGKHVRHVSAPELEAMLDTPPAADDPYTYYAPFNVEVSLYECVEDFYGRMLPELVKIAGDDIDDVRLVFFFDN